MLNNKIIKSFRIDDKNSKIYEHICIHNYTFLFIKDKTLWDKFIVGERIYIVQSYYGSVTEQTLRTILATDIDEKNNQLTVWTKR